MPKQLKLDVKVKVYQTILGLKEDLIHRRSNDEETANRVSEVLGLQITSNNVTAIKKAFGLKWPMKSPSSYIVKRQPDVTTQQLWILVDSLVEITSQLGASVTPELKALWESLKEQKKNGTDK